MKEWTAFETHVIKKLDELTIAVAHLQGKARTWGIIAGVGGAVITSLILRGLFGG